MTKYRVSGKRAFLVSDSNGDAYKFSEEFEATDDVEARVRADETLTSMGPSISFEDLCLERIDIPESTTEISIK